MKLLLFASVLGSFGSILAAPLATGTATRIPKTESYLLRFTVSEEAQPGIRFFPVIRFVLDDGTSIDGMLGCFPFAASRGESGGGEIRPLKEGAIPEGRSITSVEVLAKEGDPEEAWFGMRPDQGLAPLDEALLNRLEGEGGRLLKFTVVLAEESGAPQAD